jgi:signal transduction histidine kinase
MLGFAAPQDCVRRPLAELLGSRSDLATLLAQLATSEGTVALEVALRRADGRTVAAQLRAWRTPADAGDGSRIQGMLEERAASGGGEASQRRAPPRARAELEEMAYAVSHDLRQPLHQVIRLLELHEQEAGQRMGDDAEALLDQARECAQRLEGMVEAMLRCARIESSNEAFGPVDLDAVLTRVLERLEPERDASGAEITHGPMPTVEGDEAQLEQLLQNLLDNALKYRGGAAALVHFDAEEEADSWHLRVRDNGIGVAAKDAERIFQLFQRLHTAAEIPGSGIGLAVCRRVVARHGGRIWVESSSGKGSTFHFTLAKRPASAAGATLREIHENGS